MKRIDGHTHITPEPDLNIETSLTSYNLTDLARGYVERIKETNIEHSVAIPLDDDLLRDDDSLMSLLDVRDDAGCFSVVFLIDPLADDAIDLVKKIDEVDGLGVKLHPYVQRTGTPHHFPRIREVLAEVENKNLLTIIDCSYGGEHMYEVNGVRLGHAMAKDISSPIILAHGGGAKIQEAYLTADVFSNIYLDTSFSLTFWGESSIIQDFAFAMKQMNMNRWVWGTDRPFAGHNESIAAVENLLEEYGLTEHAEQLFYENMKQLLEGKW